MSGRTAKLKGARPKSPGRRAGPAKGASSRPAGPPLVLDVRSREEFVREHAEGALNIPLYDLPFHGRLLEGRELRVYCSTGRRGALARSILSGMGLEAKVLDYDSLRRRRGRPILCAVNFLEVLPDGEEEVHEILFRLCKATDAFPGFLGSKVLRVSGVSPLGSLLPERSPDLEFHPRKYILVTYWESKQAHEASHHHPEFERAFAELPGHLSRLPYEEFYEILR